MSIHSLGEALIKVDTIMDYIPFVSIINNTVDLIAKLSLSILSLTFFQAHHAISSHVWVKYIEEKDSIFCIGLMIPFVNIAVSKFFHNFTARPNSL